MNIKMNKIYELLQLDKKDFDRASGERVPINFAVISSGCKLNQFEASQFEEIFKRMDMNINIVEPDLSAANGNGPVDLFLVNTCAVTEKADAETNKIIRKINKNYPGSRVILTGCSVQLNKTKLSGLPGVKLIDNEKKTELLKIASEKFPGAVLRQKRIRPYLKIQEGCDLNCSYCAIPIARPSRWSLDIKSVLNSIEDFGKLGCKEVILTGVNLGAYGDADNKKNASGLKNLLNMIEGTANAVKIRLSSIDPVYIDDELIDIFASGKKIQNHFHIPLQSASDKTLGRMNRHYSFKDYAYAAAEINRKVKDAAIGTDIISGFPGETEEDFLETVDNLEKLPIYYIHAFSYSQRPGTASYYLRQKVSEKLIKQRTGKIREISFRKKVEFHKRFINRTLEFISLPGNKALSSNYIKAEIAGTAPAVPPGKFFSGKLALADNADNAGTCGGLSVMPSDYL